MDFSNFLILRDELFLIGVILVVLLFDLCAPAKARKATHVIACCLLLAQIAVCCLPQQPASAFGGMYHTSPISSLAKAMMGLGTLLVLLFSQKWLDSEHEIAKGEFYYLMLNTLLGMHFMVSAGHFLMFFIGIELASIPLACLVAYNKKVDISAEAGAKFILNAAFASGISLFGISLLYGGCGTLYFEDLAQLASYGPLEIAGLIFFATGLFFKMSLVPYHAWTADVYQGAPTNVSAYLSVVSKTAAAISLFLIFVKVFHFMSSGWIPVLYVLIILSITIANLFAIRQKDIKRFLAYSSISQAGYVALGVVAGSPQGMTGLLYYLLVYMFANIAAFGVVALVERQSGSTQISAYDGLYKTNPRLAVLMMFALFSLAGIPPFAGFFSKFFIFAAAIQQGYYILVLIALLNTIISLYYYLLVVKAMFINPNDNPVARFKSDCSSRIAMLVCLAGIVLGGIAACLYNRIDKTVQGELPQDTPVEHIISLEAASDSTVSNAMVDTLCASELAEPDSCNNLGL